MDQHDYLVLGMAAALMLINVAGASFTVRQIYLKGRNGAHTTGASSRQPTLDHLKNRQVATSLRLLARLNAETDLDIFRQLFRILDSDKEANKSALDLAVTKIEMGIASVLNVIADLFTEITADNCSVCIKVIEHAEGREKEEAIVKTLARDHKAEILGGHTPNPIQYVNDNSIYREIFLDNKDLVVIDDLVSAKAHGVFQTPSADWEGLHNSVLVAAIPPMTRSTERSAPRAVLCIQNRNGGLNNFYCIQLARESAWRLAVKLHQLEEVQKARLLDRTAA